MKRLICWLRGHNWWLDHNNLWGDAEGYHPYKECTRCGELRAEL